MAATDQKPDGGRKETCRPIRRSRGCGLLGQHGIRIAQVKELRFGRTAARVSPKVQSHGAARSGGCSIKEAGRGSTAFGCDHRQAGKCCRKNWRHGSDCRSRKAVVGTAEQGFVISNLKFLI